MLSSSKPWEHAKSQVSSEHKAPASVIVVAAPPSSAMAVPAPPSIKEDTPASVPPAVAPPSGVCGVPASEWGNRSPASASPVSSAASQNAASTTTPASFSFDSLAPFVADRMFRGRHARRGPAKSNPSHNPRCRAGGNQERLPLVRGRGDGDLCIVTSSPNQRARSNGCRD